MLVAYCARTKRPPCACTKNGIFMKQRKNELKNYKLNSNLDSVFNFFNSFFLCFIKTSLVAVSASGLH